MLAIAAVSTAAAKITAITSHPDGGAAPRADTSIRVLPSQALGAIASYAVTRDMQAVRVVF